MIKKENPYLLQFEKLVYTNFEDSIYTKFESLVNEFTNSTDRLKFLYKSKELFNNHRIGKLTKLSFDTFYFTKLVKKEITHRDFVIRIFEYPLVNNFSYEELSFIKINYNLLITQNNKFETAINPNLNNSNVFKDLTIIYSELIPKAIQIEKSKLEVIKKKHRYNGKFTFKIINKKFDVKKFYDLLKSHSFINEKTKFSHFKKIFDDINLPEVYTKVTWNSNATQLLAFFKILISEGVIEKRQHATLSIINFLFVNEKGEHFDKENWKVIFCIVLKAKQLSNGNRMLIDKIISDSFVKRT